MAHARKSIFACPDGYASATSTLANTTDLTQRRKLMLVYGYRNASGVVQPESHYLAYGVNMNAGSFLWYHNNRYNQGFYPLPEWDQLKINATRRSTTQLSKIGYLFETNIFGMNENHTLTQYSQIHNSWTQAGLHFNPTARHQGATTTNMVYADGHMGILGDEYYSNNRGPFPFSWY